MLKPSICGVGNEEKHIYEPNKSNLASPLLAIDRQLPWMYIAESNISFKECKEFMMKEVHTNHTPMYCPQ